jgi:diguanylate cyclase (GGDEF)-like protein
MPSHIFNSLRAASTSGAYLRRSVLKRLAIFLALALSLVWLAVALHYKQLSDIAERESKRDLQNLAFAFSEEVSSTINTVDLSLLQLRSHWQRNRGDFSHIVNELNRELHGKVILQVAVTDARGKVVFHSAVGGDGTDLSDREHIRVHLEGRGDALFVGRPLFARVFRAWAVQFTRPVYGKDGELAGVIVASVDPAYFSRFYSSIDLGPGSSIALVRWGGTIIARTTKQGSNEYMGKTMLGEPYQPGHMPSGYFRRTGQIDRVDRYYAWRDLPDFGLMVTVGQAVADADERYAHQKTIAIGTGIALSLVIALLGWANIASSDNRRRAVAALAAAETRWKLALTAAGDGVWDCNLATGQATLSSRAQAILDVDRPVMPCNAHVLRSHMHPQDRRRVMRALKDHFARRTPDFVAEHRLRKRNGEWTWVLARGMLAERMPDGRPLRMVGTFVNIDARKCEEEQIRYLAHHDALTGLPNRVLFSDRLSQAIRVAQRERTKVAVLYFDLDKFKPVNDTYGHAVGDRLLEQIAARVRSSLRDSDTLARFGGDEFVVLLPRCGGASDAAKVGDNILALLNRPFDVDGHMLSISGSMGYALYPDSGVDEEQLLRCADQSMYHAKSQGQLALGEAAEAAGLAR